MKGFAYRNRPRSLGAQIDRMSKCWPNFAVVYRRPNAVKWYGPLKGFERIYTVGITWAPDWRDRPYVQLLDLPLVPPEGGL